MRDTLESTLSQAQGVPVQKKHPTWKAKALTVDESPCPPPTTAHALGRKIIHPNYEECMFKDKYKEL